MGRLDVGNIGHNVAAVLVPSGTTETIDWESGAGSTIQLLDLSSATGDVTLTLSNPIEGALYEIIVIQGATPRQLIWPGSVTWLRTAGFAPVIPSGAGVESKVQLRYDGSTYFGTFDSPTTGSDTWKKDEFVPTAAQVTFILGQAPQDSNSIIFEVNGVIVDDVSDFTVSGVTVTWLNTNYVMATTDKVIIRYQ